eukprot:gene47137-58822_t
MFEWEERAVDHETWQKSADAFIDVLSEAPKYHMLSFAIRFTCCDVLKRQGRKAELLEMTELAIAPFQVACSFPSTVLMNLLQCAAFNFFQTDSTEGNQLAFSYCQQALQMRRLLLGESNSDIDTLYALLTVLHIRVHPPLSAVPECAFCGASPLTSTVTLTPCDKDSQVVYCSEKCKKWHGSQMF